MQLSITKAFIYLHISSSYRNTWHMKKLFICASYINYYSHFVVGKTEAFPSLFIYKWEEAEFKYRSSTLKVKVLHFSGQTEVSEPPYGPSQKPWVCWPISFLTHETFICSFIKWHHFNKLKKTDGEAHQVGSTRSTKVIKQLLAGAHSSLKYNNV